VAASNAPGNPLYKSKKLNTGMGLMKNWDWLVARYRSYIDSAEQRRRIQQRHRLGRKATSWRCGRAGRVRVATAPRRWIAVSRMGASRSFDIGSHSMKEAIMGNQGTKQVIIGYGCETARASTASCGSKTLATPSSPCAGGIRPSSLRQRVLKDKQKLKEEITHWRGVQQYVADGSLSQEEELALIDLV
jgi:hypothetical protein